MVFAFLDPRASASPWSALPLAHPLRVLLSLCPAPLLPPWPAPPLPPQDPTGSVGLTAKLLSVLVLAPPHPVPSVSLSPAHDDSRGGPASSFSP